MPDPPPPPPPTLWGLTLIGALQDVSLFIYTDLVKFKSGKKTKGKQFTKIYVYSKKFI